MPTLEYCQIEVCQDIKKGLFRKTTYHWEARKITPTGTETLYKSGDYSLTYSGDPVSMKNELIKEKETREEVVRYMLSQGWVVAGSDEKGNVVAMQREIVEDGELGAADIQPDQGKTQGESVGEETPERQAKGSIKSRLENLKEIYEAGLISEVEYIQIRSDILKEI